MQHNIFMFYRVRVIENCLRNKSEKENYHQTISGMYFLMTIN